jgi:hypothetical protein
MRLDSKCPYKSGGAARVGRRCGPPWAIGPRAVMQRGSRRRRADAATRGGSARSDGRGELITSQVPVSKWHEVIANPTLGDAILDRIVQQRAAVVAVVDDLEQIAALLGIERLRPPVVDDQDFTGQPALTRNGAPTSPPCRPAKVGCISPSSSICSHAGSSAGQQVTRPAAAPGSRRFAPPGSRADPPFRVVAAGTARGHPLGTTRCVWTAPAMQGFWVGSGETSACSRVSGLEARRHCRRP